MIRLLIAFACVASALDLDVNRQTTIKTSDNDDALFCTLPRSFPDNTMPAPQNPCSASGSLASGEVCKIACATGYSFDSGTVLYRCPGGVLVEPTIVCVPSKCKLPQKFGTQLTTPDPKEMPSPCYPGVNLGHNSVCDVSCPATAANTNGGTLQYICSYGVLTAPTATCYSTCTIPQLHFQSIGWVRGVLPTYAAGGCNPGDILLPGQQCYVTCPTNPDKPEGWVTSAGDLFYKCSEDGNLILPTATCQSLTCPMPYLGDGVDMAGLATTSSDSEPCSLCATTTDLTCYNFCRVICKPGFKPNPEYAPGAVPYLQCFGGQLYTGAPAPYHVQDNPCFKINENNQGHYLRIDFTFEKMGKPYRQENLLCIPDAKDCIASWSDPSPCDVTCGDGHQTQTYTITSFPQNGGKKCDDVQGAIRTSDCGAGICPVDCEGIWGSPTGCTATCGGGSYEETYTHTVLQAGSGAHCDIEDGATRSTECGKEECPVDCKGDWTEYGVCSVSCGGGKSKATYHVSRDAAHGGQPCPYLDGAEDFEVCSTDACPVDCIGAFDSWTDCGVTCGGGTISQTFVVSQPAANGGADCDTENGFVQTRPCAINGCPVDCAGSFDDWSSCSQTCDAGTRSRRFTVEVEAQYDGAECDHNQGEIDVEPCVVDTAETSESCVHPPDPVDCVGSWSEFGSCSSSCGDSKQERIFTVTTPSANAGAECEAADGQVESKDCIVDPCPVDCLGEWGNFNDCDVTCGGSSHSQVYQVATPAAYGGAECPYSDGESHSEPCGTENCPVDCAGDFGAFGECPVTCGGGLKTSVFQIWTEAAFGGLECPHADGEEATEDCEQAACPVDCEGEWGTFSSCSATCGGGSQVSTFKVTTPAQHGGAECKTKDGAEEVIACGEQACPVDCAGSWSEYSECTATCGYATHSKTFSIIQHAEHGGQQCDTADQEEASEKCNLEECPPVVPVDCVGTWSEFDACDVTCGGGKYARAWLISQNAENGGVECEHKQGHLDLQDCGTEGCPVDCIGAWTSFSVCTHPCGGGESSRVFHVTVAHAFGGAKCEADAGDTQTMDCGQEPCSADCVGRWEESECSKTCGGGKLTSTFHIEVAAISNGNPCDAEEGASKEVDCNTDPCPLAPTPSPTPAPTPVCPTPKPAPDCSCGCNSGCHSSCCPTPPVPQAP